jgi:two-component system, response regulator PdtaR
MAGRGFRTRQARRQRAMSTPCAHHDLPRRVLVADDESLVAHHIAAHLTELGIEPVGPASSGQQAIELAGTASPDLALLDIRMPQVDGLEAAGVLYHRMGIPIVLLSAFSDQAYVQQGARIGVYGYLIKPVSVDELRAALAVAWSRFHQHVKLKGEVESLKVALEERKLIERAKGLVMERMNLTEPQAMRRLQKQARDTRRRLAEVARGILDGDQLLQPRPPGALPPSDPRV